MPSPGIQSIPEGRVVGTLCMPSTYIRAPSRIQSTVLLGLRQVGLSTLDFGTATKLARTPSTSARIIACRPPPRMSLSRTIASKKDKLKA